ncbi:hypothetical protein G7046_g3585 [Stylonectria norvegica]|nr:hypothetical protein G7046_g3585 [Stylonectria norvegica]
MRPHINYSDLCKMRKARLASSDGATSPRDVGALLRHTLDLEPDERELLMFLLAHPQALQYYVLSPSSETAEQQSLASSLVAAFPVLKDAYLAYAGVLKSISPGNSTDAPDLEADESESLRYASSALVTLRTLPVANSEDAAICLSLGTALARFVYAAVGAGGSDICKYCLSTTKPFINAATLVPETEAQLIFLVLLETMECLIHRRKPTVRIQPRAPESIDRRLGLCLPLLPYYHDLCVISNSLVSAIDENAILLLRRKLQAVQTFVDTWQPSLPEHVASRYGTVEVINLLAQAKVYRLAALLMAHRLQHAFGQEDTQADIWSHEVMMELDLAQRITRRAVRFVTLPFIIAAVEVRGSDGQMKAVQDVDKYVDQSSPIVQKATKTFLWRVWREREAQETLRWFDSVHKPCVILGSIEEAVDLSFVQQNHVVGCL